MSDIDEMNVGLKWYVAHTYSGYENKVKTSLEKIVENRGLGNLIYDIKIPVETVIEKDGDKEKTEEIKENQKRIEEGQERIALLEAELLEIKRPYDTALGRFFAKIANAVINAVYAVVRWFEKIFKKG